MVQPAHKCISVTGKYIYKAYQEAMFIHTSNLPTGDIQNHTCKAYQEAMSIHTLGAYLEVISYIRAYYGAI